MCGCRGTAVLPPGMAAGAGLAGVDDPGMWLHTAPNGAENYYPLRWQAEQAMAFSGGSVTPPTPAGGATG